MRTQYIRRLFSAICGAALLALGFNSSPSHADEDVFPNLENYPDITDYSPYARELRGDSQAYVQFSTTDNINCTLTMLYAECEGPKLPGFPTNTPDIAWSTTGCAIQVAKTVTPELHSFYTNNIPCDQPYNAVLPVGHRIEQFKTVCLVGENHLLACRNDQNHGFVLKENSGALKF